MKKKVVLSGLVLALTLSVVGVSLGGTSFKTEADAQLPPRTALAQIDDLDALSTKNAFTLPEQKSFEILEGQVGTYRRDDEGSVSKIDIGSARPFAIPSDKGYVWVAKTSDGGICAFTPQLAPGMSGGFTAACNPLKDFNGSGLAGLSRIGENEFLGYSIQPPGVEPPVVVDVGGESEVVPVRSGVAIAILGHRQALKTGGLTLTADDLPKSEK